MLIQRRRDVTMHECIHSGCDGPYQSASFSEFIGNNAEDFCAHRHIVEKKAPVPV